MDYVAIFRMDMGFSVEITFGPLLTPVGLPVILTLAHIPLRVLQKDSQPGADHESALCGHGMGHCPSR